ncbi:MAG: YggT family protein [Burkholderiales bacterium]|nr:YggT family protein [Burkholderiales bacterium]
MLADILSYLIRVAADFLVYLLLARFHMQWLRAPFRNPVGEFVIAATNWIVAPARRVVPAAAGLDLATLLLAWLGQALALAALAAVRATTLEPAALALLAALDLLRYSLHILVFALIVQALLSWTSPYSPLAPLFDALTRRFLAPIRRVVPPLGGVDVSPLVLLVVLQVLFIPLAHLRVSLAGIAL